MPSAFDPRSHVLLGHPVGNSRILDVINSITCMHGGVASIMTFESPIRYFVVKISILNSIFATRHVTRWGCRSNE